MTDSSVDNARVPARVLVWGGTGFMGRNLVSALLRNGYAVSVLTRVARLGAVPPGWGGRVTWHTYDDAQDRAAFARAVDGAQIIFNLAGSSGAIASNRRPVESLEGNCRVQLSFLQAVQEAAARPHVVFASSRLVYAPNSGIPVRESDPVAPLSIYGAHKLCVEHYHRVFAGSGSLTFTVCRISNPFGPDPAQSGKAYGFVNTLIENACLGVPMTLFGGGTQLRDYLYISDLTNALIRCGTRREALNETFNIGRGIGLSMHDAARLIQNRVGGSIEVKPWPPEYVTVESGDFVADISKARALLDFHPQYDFESGLSEMFERSHVDECAAPQSGRIAQLPIHGGVR